MMSWHKLEEGCPEVLPASIYGVPKSGYLNKQGRMHLIEDTSQLDIGKLKKVYDNLISDRNQQTDVQLNTIELLSNGQVMKDVHISYPTQSILRKFRRFAEKHGFAIVDSFCDEMYLVRNSFRSRLKLALCCLLPSYRPATSRFYVYTDEYRSVRVLVMENLNCGDSYTIELRHLLSNFCERHFPAPALVEDLDNEQDMKTLEATSKYMYSKMLLEENYSMGQKVNAFLSVSNDSISLQNIEWIENVKNQMVSDMLEGFNCSRKELTQILCFCRTVVEEFLYSRIFPLDSQQQKTLAAEEDRIWSRYPQATRELLRLDSILCPTLFDRQVYYVSAAFQTEYEQNRQGDSPTTQQSNRLDVLTQLLRELRLRNLPKRMKIQQLYHQLNCQPEYYHQFEVAMSLTQTAYRHSLLQK